MLKDVMAGFELFHPTDIDSALALLERFGERGWVMAGGYDTLDWLKDRTKSPEAVIDLERIPELRGVTETPDGIEIGAMTTLADVEAEIPSHDVDATLLDLSLWLYHKKNELSGRFEYNVDLFEPSTIERIDQHLARLLAEIVSDPDRCIWDLPMLADGERQPDADSCLSRQ